MAEWFAAETKIAAVVIGLCFQLSAAESVPVPASPAYAPDPEIVRQIAELPPGHSMLLPPVKHV